jgi:flagellar motor switch protein FliM
MTQQIQIAEVEMIADFGTARVTLGDLLNMKVGDIIPVHVPEIITAKVDGTPVIECQYGVSNGQYALKVDKLLSSSVQEVIQGENHG